MAGVIAIGFIIFLLGVWTSAVISWCITYHDLKKIKKNKKN